MKSRLLLLLLVLGTAVAVVQQQLLLKRPPRLVRTTPQPIQSGSAALDLSFSRPMRRQSLAKQSRLSPGMTHRWLGDNTPLRLVIESNDAISAPLKLAISGRDQRGQRLPTQTRWWDPRPWLMVNRVVDGGEQLQLQGRNGRWHSISPVWPGIKSIVPLGNGRGIAMVSSHDNGEERIWLTPLKTRSIAARQQELSRPQGAELKPLMDRPMLFAHLSSNLIGDLLVQTGGFGPGSERIELIRRDGTRQELEVLASGPLQLLPAGGGLVVPAYNGLELQPLINKGAPAQILPGSRELAAFCAASGRAVLIRHWPDYRRSIELVIPGLAPKQLHLGDQAVLAVACNNSGKRIWAVLGRWRDQQGEHEIVMMDGEGTVLRKQSLSPWTLKSGTPMQFDPVGRQLLITVTQKGLQHGRAALLESESLTLRQVLPEPVEEAQWLMAG